MRPGRAWQEPRMAGEDRPRGMTVAITMQVNDA